MATKNTDNTAAERETVAEEEASAAKIPHQADKPHLEVVEGTVVDDRSLTEKVKGVFTNKKFLAGVSSVVLIAAGVLVVNKKRNENVSEDEVTSD